MDAGLEAVSTAKLCLLFVLIEVFGVDLPSAIFTVNFFHFNDVSASSDTPSCRTFPCRYNCDFLMELFRFFLR